MNVSTLLNSDVKTLRVLAARGFHWWVGQLEELLPGSRRGRRGPRHKLVWQDGSLRVLGKAGTAGRMPSKGARIWLAVPQQLAFVRTLELPRMGAADLRRLVQLEAERLSPLPTAEAIVGIEVGRRTGNAPTVPVEIAVLPLAAAEQAITAAQEAGLSVARLGLLPSNERLPRFDFLPALRERGLLPASRPASAIWWSFVAFVLALNLAILVIRDEQSVARFQNIVEQQAPSVAAAKAIRRRAAEFDSTARDLQYQRRGHDVLSALAVASSDLPAGAWVQRLNYSARTARLVGYKQKDIDVTTALRKDKRIAAVRSNTAQLVTDTPAGQPFDVTIVLRSGT
jgi:hypothetical protein